MLWFVSLHSIETCALITWDTYWHFLTLIKAISQVLHIWRVSQLFSQTFLPHPPCLYMQGFLLYFIFFIYIIDIIFCLSFHLWKVIKSRFLILKFSNTSNLYFNNYLASSPTIHMDYALIDPNFHIMSSLSR